ncbi:Na+/H+ antiporter subunit E [Azospirillum sp. ST 5-10]|uniref:Na+/H+ antiporter subunit E n=1 Tax=unclassified Azospirillum TaxID=2630922 RepID=UPI003F49F0F7
MTIHGSGLDRVGRGRIAAAAAVRAALFAVLWVVLTGRPAESWPYGLIAVALAVPVSLLLQPPRTAGLRVVRVAVLVPLLAWVSLLGGFDVARRAFARRPAVDPGVVDYRLRHPRPAIAVTLAYAASVVPGSLVLAVGDDRLLVHVVDLGQPNDATLARMEGWLAWALPDAP